MSIKNQFSLLNRYVYFCLRKLTTYTYYKIFLSSLGAKTFIGKPLYITCQHLSIGHGVYIWPNSRIEGIESYANKTFTPTIFIEDNVSIQQNLHLTCADEIIIGKDTAIAANVTITDINHSYSDIHIPPEKQDLQVEKIKIGEACKIYNNAVILPGTNLGKHTIIAANSVVLKGIYPSYSVLAGAPAKIIKRYCEITSQWLPTFPDGTFKNKA